MSGSSNHPADPKKLPVPYKAPTGARDIEHHTHEWSSGTRGGGKVPDDLGWHSNPKQYQEERGAGDADAVISK